MGATTVAYIQPLGDNRDHVESVWGEDRALGKRVNGTIAGSASYDTGGSVADLSAYFKYQVTKCIVFQNGSKFLPVYVPATGKAPATGLVKVVDSTSGSEVVSTTDLHLQTWDFIAWGL